MQGTTQMYRVWLILLVPRSGMVNFFFKIYVHNIWYSMIARVHVIDSLVMSLSTTSSECATVSSLSGPEQEKRKVSHVTYMTWRGSMDRECSTMSWLDCEMQVSARKKVVSKLRCSVWCKFKERIVMRSNFSTRWIEGADSARTSSIRDHARADLHVHAMMLYKRECAKAYSAGACCSYDTSSIATAL